MNNIKYRHSDTNTLNLSDTTSKFYTDGTFTTADVHATFDIQGADISSAFIPNFVCLVRNVCQLPPSNNKLKKISAGLSCCHFIFYKTYYLPETERICILYYHPSFHDSNVSDANVPPTLQVREATMLLLVDIFVLVATTRLV